MKRLAAALLVLGCSKAAPKPAPDSTFLWGTATAAHQVEGGLHENDFWQWQQRGKITDGSSADDGPDSWRRFEDDLALMAAQGHTAYRFSIEWSRVEPREGAWDEVALARYGQMLDLMAGARITPMVTLIHYTLPVWVHDLNALDARPGWRGLPSEAIGKAAIVGRAARYAGEMARRFGDRVDWWVTLNEPTVVAGGGWGTGELPPGRILDFAGLQRAAGNQIHAHAAMTDAIRANDRVARVSIAQHLRVFVPKDPSSAADVRGAGQVQRVFNDLFLDACARGDLDLDFDGKFEKPGEGRGLPALAGRLDFVGINYYSRSVVVGTDIGDQETGIRLFGWASENENPAVPHNDLGWEIYPQGLHDLIRYVWARYELPIVVTENGVSEPGDELRPRFLVDHILAVQQAMREGADVRGYLHWSLIDNFEWNRGYTARFGLASVDRASPTRTRTPRGSAGLYSRIIASHGVTPEIAASVGR